MPVGHFELRNRTTKRVVVGQIQRGSAGPWSNGRYQIDRQIGAPGQIGQIGAGPREKIKKMGGKFKKMGENSKNWRAPGQIEHPPAGPPSGLWVKLDTSAGALSNWSNSGGVGGPLLEGGMEDRKTIWVCGFLHVPSRDIVNEWIMTCWDGRRPPTPEIQSQNFYLFYFSVFSAETTT